MTNSVNHSTINSAINSTTNTLSQPDFTRLRELRRALLTLHRTLLATERISYEQVRGWVPNGELLQLVIHHPHFAWLHRISELVVQIDEVLRSDEPVSSDQVQSLLNDVRSLLSPSEVGNGFEKRYYNALQRDPAAVLAHAEVARLLPEDSTSTQASEG